MNTKHISFFLLLLSCIFSNAHETRSFLALDVNTNEISCERGTTHQERVSPCSTFKIALSLMGYDSGILIDTTFPEWTTEKTDLPYEMWKGVQTPKTWIKNSVVWYSQQLTPQIGLKRINDYLASFKYGNMDMSGDPSKDNGLTHAWLGSSLKISPTEQIRFLQKLVSEELPVSKHAITMTKALLFQSNVKGWRLYGKTGSGSNGLIWYIGWLEKDQQVYVFTLNIQNCKKRLSPLDRKIMVLYLLKDQLASHNANHE